MARNTSGTAIIPEITQAEGLRAFVEKMDILTDASGGAVQLTFDTEWLAANGGDFVEPVVFSQPSGGVRHSDEANPATGVTPTAISQAKGATVFQTNYAYYSWTRDMERRGKMTPQQYSIALGRILANDKFVKLRNNVVAAGVAAIDSMDTPSANYHIVDDTAGYGEGAPVNFSHIYVNELLSKMRDAREDIVTFLMPAAIFHDLAKDSAATYKVDKVAGANIVEGIVAAQGRRILVADIPALITTNSSGYYTHYQVLGLGVGALSARVIGEDPITMTTVTDDEVFSWTFRQDFDTEFAVQGMAWDLSPVNPTDAELATAGNWGEFLDDHRQCKIVKGVFNSSLDQ